MWMSTYVNYLNSSQTRICVRNCNAKKKAPNMGLEPMTLRLRVLYALPTELAGQMLGFCVCIYIYICMYIYVPELRQIASLHAYVFKIQSMIFRSAQILVINNIKIFQLIGFLKLFCYSLLPFTPLILYLYQPLQPCYNGTSCCTCHQSHGIGN